MPGCQTYQFLSRNLFRKADHLEITGMDFQQHNGLFTDRFLIIFQMRTIRSSYFNKPGTAFHHYLGNPERTANFHKLSPRNNNLPVLSECVKDKQHRCRIIIDNQGSFCTSQITQDLLNKTVTASSSAGCQVKFQIGIPCSCFHNSFTGTVWQYRTSKIGMNYYAGRINHPLKVRPQFYLQPFTDLGQ